ncbi:MAG: serine hydrolase domain-containing protein [Pseudohongiellaceae bacterium]
MSDGNDELVAQIDEFVESYRKRNMVPGIAVAVTQGGNVVHVQGYGADSNGNPVDANTVFPIASLSKSFTALAVMQFVERGIVALDEPVVSYLPEFVMADERAQTITLRQLLTHTSGLSDRSFPEKSLPQPHTLSAAVARLAPAGLEVAPGGANRYHNPNYQIVARLIEVLSGEPFDEYMRQNVFEPIGMIDARTIASLEQDSRVSNGHIRFFGLPVSMPEPYWFLEGSSGVVTTASDMSNWLQMLNNSGRTFDGGQVISPESLEVMFTPTDIRSRRGLGWSIRNDGEVHQVQHTGWLFTYTANHTLLDHGELGIFAVASTGIGLAAADADMIVEGLQSILLSGDQVRAGLPFGLLGGIAIIILIVLTSLRGVWRLRKIEKIVERRQYWPVWKKVVWLLPMLVPVVFLVYLRNLLSWLFGGRDGTWLQTVYVASPLIVWLGVLILVNFVFLMKYVNCENRYGRENRIQSRHT